MVWQGRRLGEKEGDRNATEMPATPLDVLAWGGEVGSALEKWLALSGAGGGKGRPTAAWQGHRDAERVTEDVCHEHNDPRICGLFMGPVGPPESPSWSLCCCP